MGADNSTLSRLCGPPANADDVQSEVQSEISQQHQRSKTDNYDEVEDSSSDGNVYGNVNDDEKDNYNNENNENNNTETSEQKYDSQALLVLMERELQSTKDENRRTINRYDIKLSEIESELREIKANLKNELDHKTILENKLKSLNEEYEKLKNSQTLENDEQIKEMQQQLEQYTEQKTNEIEEYETEIDNYKQNIDDLNEQITEQKEENDKINEKNTQLENKINKILNEQMEQNNNSNNNNNMNSVYTQKIEILENKINELNETKQSQTDEITRLHSEINEYKPKLEEIKTLQAEIIELKNTIAVKQETIDSLKLKLQNASQSTYSNENKQNENENEEEEDETTDLTELIDELKADNNKLQKQNEILETIKTEHEQCKGIVAQLKTDNQSTANTEIEKLKQEIEYYKSQMNNNNNSYNNSPQPPPPQTYLNISNDVYTITFDRKPFGITFGNTKDKKNLIVNKIDPNSIAYEKNVINKSKIIKLENESTEDLGAKIIFKMFKEKFGNQLPLTITFRKPIGANAMLSDNYTSLSDYNSAASDDNKAPSPQIKIIQPQIDSDEKYDINTEVTHVSEWLKIDSSNKQKVKQLKEQLASLLTTRPINYKQLLCNKYKNEYEKSIQKDIKLIIGNGTCMDIIDGLLMTYAQYDVMLIINYMKYNEFESIADIICCRNIKQLSDIRDAYKEEKKLDIKQQLKALAQNDGKKTLVKVMEGIFDLDTKDNVLIDMNDISSDLTFIFSVKKFKDNTKERLAVMLTSNSVTYIRKLNEQFMLKSKDNLAKWIDKKLGNKSTVGYYCKQRITFAISSADYYALKIRKFGTQFKKYQKQILHIFIGRMEIDLNEISKTWDTNKYGGAKDLKKWITSKTSDDYDAYYLEKILDNCSRYAS